ncbi:MAG: type IX secretion system membrane protein PorP/SprF, partial [Chitinophagales bacterium]|nr:type IX secretion system membrane protein PorP/SprF [Chitinophagales bacterium]
SNDPSSETLIQFNLIGAYTIDINSLWKITPSVLFKYLETMPSQMDMQAHLLYNDQFQLDLGYRTNTTYIVGVSYKFLDELQVGYCYDLDNSSFGSTSGGSHELTVGYVFNKSKSE